MDQTHINDKSGWMNQDIRIRIVGLGLMDQNEWTEQDGWSRHMQENQDGWIRIDGSGWWIRIDESGWMDQD